MKEFCVDIFSINNSVCKELSAIEQAKVKRSDVESALRDHNYRKFLNCINFEKVEIVESCSKYVTFEKAKEKLFPGKYEYYKNNELFKKKQYFGYKEVYLDDFDEGIVEKILSEIYSISGNREKTNVNKETINSLGINIEKNEYLIIWVDSKTPIVYKNTEGPFYRLVEHKRAPYNFELKDVYQKIAYDSCLNKDVATIIDGPMGSGKTLIALLASLAMKEIYEKIYIIRPNIGIDPKFDIGFLPGSVEEKMYHWIGGIITNLTYIMGSESKAQAMLDATIKNIPINMIQGYSIHNAIVIVDESQFLPLDLVKQIISRIASSSKLIMLFDEKQSYNITDYIGLKKIIDLLPNDVFSYVKLKNIYRSKLAEFAENL